MKIPAIHSSRSGSAIIIILVLLGMISVLLVSNGRTLRHLHQNIQIIEQRQLKKYRIPVKDLPAEHKKP